MVSIRSSRSRPPPNSGGFSLPSYYHASSASTNDMLPLTHAGAGIGNGANGTSTSSGNLRYAPASVQSPTAASTPLMTQKSSLSSSFTSRAYSHHHSSQKSRFHTFLMGNAHQEGFCGKPLRAMLATILFIVFVTMISSDEFHNWEFDIRRNKDNDGGASSTQQSFDAPLQNSAKMTATTHIPSQSPKAGINAQSQNQIPDAHFFGALQAGYFQPQDAILPPDDKSFKFVAITDLDQLSVVRDAKKPTFRAIMLSGIIHCDSNIRGNSGALCNRYSIAVGETREVRTRHNEAGRGAEYSDLILYQERLFTMDDRTGGLIEILNSDDGTSSRVIPRTVFMEGDGMASDKGMKWEWSAIKDGELYLGSIGKEYTNRDGSIRSLAPLWVVIISPNGQVRRENWTSKYDYVRKVMHAQYPGYLVQEAVRWSDHLQKWVFLPRRISKHEYVAAVDERLGSNKIVLVNEDFTDSTVIQVDYHDSEAGLRGFAAFSFVPNSNDHHALIVRSVEEDCAGETLDELWKNCKQRTFLSVLDITTGNILMEEVAFDEKFKFEGIEFADIDTRPPPIHPQTAEDHAKHQSKTAVAGAGEVGGAQSPSQVMMDDKNASNSGNVNTNQKQ
mmetsp:Transcript_7488/g.21875  ORF Transcript_7488/g.21875 Transcript_7488/m.21875 type:complete len:616 (+) Transcript_7488:217-2064(+)